MIPNYTVNREAPAKRRGQHDGSYEACFHEAAVMQAYAMHLLRKGATSVEMHPDGMHAKVHDVSAAFLAAGFERENGRLDTCAGLYAKRGRRVTVDFRSGVGDVVATVRGWRIIAECKGGIVNTRHNGQRSRLRRGLCEAVGQLIGRELEPRERHVAVVPYTSLTHTLANRIAPRANRAGISIALIKPDGRVVYVGAKI